MVSRLQLSCSFFYPEGLLVVRQTELLADAANFRIPPAVIFAAVAKRSYGARHLTAASSHFLPVGFVDPNWESTAWFSLHAMGPLVAFGEEQLRLQNAKTGRSSIETMESL